MKQTEANKIFEAYYQKKITLDGAVLPEEKIAVLEGMELELNEKGLIPISENQVAQFNPSHPVFEAILAGEQVNVSGEEIGEKRGGLAGLSTGAKIGVLVGIMCIPVLLVFAFLRINRGGDEQAEVVALVEETEPTETPTAIPTAVPTEVIVLPPVVVEPLATPTPSEAVGGVSGSVAPSQGDPASIEIGGRSFILATGETKNGVWSPRGAEWLTGTSIRRVIAIPYEDEFEADLLEMVGSGVDGQLINIRLRSGEVVTYQIDGATWYRRDQIEVLTSDVPSVVVVISKGNEREDEPRFVISGTALN